MSLSRREFATALGATAVGVTAQRELPTRETVRALLEAQGPLGVFEDADWLELLREALPYNDQIRATLQAYELSSDAEPVIAFARY